MKPVEGWKKALFVGGLTVIALFFTWQRQNGSGQDPFRSSSRADYQPERTATPAHLEDTKAAESKLALAKLAAQEKAAAHAKFLERNVYPGFSRRPVPTVAVVSATADGKLNPQLTSNLIRRLATNGVEFVSSLFTPEFVSSGNLQLLADGSNELISRLELTNAFDGVVLAKETVTFETTPSLENLVTASLQLEISIIRFADHNGRETFVWNASGPGFRENDARLAAEERVMKQIARDTNFYVMPTRPLK